MRITIVGAGVIGAACADALARAGHDVHVLDMRGPGRGASQASAGVLAPWIEGHHGDPLLDLCIDSLGLYDAFIDGVRASSGLPVEYARTGTIEVALSETHEMRLRASAAQLAGSGARGDWLDGAAVHAADPSISPSVRGGLRIPAHGYVHVPQLIAALMQSARYAGASVEYPASVIRVEPTKTEVAIVMDGERRVADAVVVAAGAWSGKVRIANLPPIEVRPIRGQLLHLAWPESLPLPSQVVWAERCYLVPWRDRTLLVGATAEDVGFDERTTVAGVRDLMDAAGEILPGTWQAALREVRVGLRPAPSGTTPLVGPASPGSRVWLATGHFRNGAMLAPLTARQIVSAIEGNLNVS